MSNFAGVLHIKCVKWIEAANVFYLFVFSAVDCRKFAACLKAGQQWKVIRQTIAQSLNFVELKSSNCFQAKTKKCFKSNIIKALLAAAEFRDMNFEVDDVRLWNLKSHRIIHIWVQYKMKNHSNSQRPNFDKFCNLVASSDS